VVTSTRAERIAERIQEELSEILIFQIADPRLKGVSITDVNVDRELAFSDIYFSALDGSGRAEEILEGFNHARGYIRTELASRITLRTFPRLRFHWDPTFERAERIDRLLDSISETDEMKSSNQINDESSPQDDPKLFGDKVE
jgi:ribosome-binding factor A